MNLLKLVILPALIALVKADLPIDVDFVYEDRNYGDFVHGARNDGDTVYRLPELLDPIHFDVEITPYFAATEARAAFTFDGIVTMTVTAVADGITELTIHENVLEIVGVTVTTESGTTVLLNVNQPFERLREYHFLKIYLADGVTLVNGENYIIRVVYLGNMNETPLSRGVFRGSYIGDDGNQHWYAATHLQPTNSRQAFPCFDEPGFKSTFTIIVNRLATYADTYSNMHLNHSDIIGDRVREVFNPTPRMSAYLVTFHISEEFTVIADNNDPERSYRILARPNAQGQGEYALEVGPPLTKWLEEYLGIPYYTMGEQMKNDQIASPDWASGATENWGLVTYREVRLLYEEGETNAADKMSVGTITAHELAHKWFGNLVTCRWWDNVWINEGYASYFEYFAMDAVYPEMELEDQFIIMYLQSSLSTDSSAATRALQHSVNSPTEVTGHFSGISYSKGASLLNMLKHFLTEETFRKALNYYLVDMSYEHAFPSDVYRGFERAVQEDGVLGAFPGLNVTDFVEYWVDQPGFPVLNVDVDVDTGVMSLSQERFFISATATQTDQVWPLPLTYTTQSSPNWDQQRATHVMTARTDSITKAAGDEWVIFNIKQNGIYRVNYNTHNWELLATALKENPSSIHHLNRAQIVDDVFALMRSERMSYELGFRVLQFLKEETSYFVWYPAISGFSWLRNRFLHLPATLAEFEGIIHEYLSAVVAELGFEPAAAEPLTRTLNRFYTMSFACNSGHEACISDSVDKFQQFFENGVSVEPNLRRHVYCSGLRAGGRAHWARLLQRLLAANNQAAQVATLRALGCTSDPSAVQEYLELILSASVRAQDRVNAFTFLFMGDRGNARRALPFIAERIDDIRDAVVGTVRLNTVMSNLAGYMDEDGLQEMQAWLEANQASIPEAGVGLSAISSARASMQWGDARAAEVLAAARAGAALAAPAPAALLLACLLYIAMLLKP